MKIFFILISLFVITGCRVDLDVKDINGSSNKSRAQESSEQNISQASLECTLKSTSLSIIAPFLDTQGECNRPLSKSLLIESEPNPMIIRSNGEFVVGSGNGFAISSDQGQSWRHITQIDGISEFRFLEDIAEDPAGNVYLCYDFGTYVTRDNFQSFQLLSNTAETNNCKSIHISAGGQVYIGHVSNISVSSDNGLNFSHVASGTTGGSMGIERIVSDDDNNIYAVAYNSGTSQWFLLVSNNNGLSFVPNNSSALFPSSSVISNSLAFNGDKEELYIAFFDTGLHVSEDYGDSFSTINNFSHPSISDLAVGTSITKVAVYGDDTGMWVIGDEDYYYSADPLTFGFTHVDYTPPLGYSAKPLNIITTMDKLYSLQTTGLHTYDSESSSIKAFSAIDPINEGVLPNSIQQFRTNGDDILIAFDEYTNVDSYNISYSKDGGKTFSFINSYSHFPAGFNGDTNYIKDVAILSDKSILIAVEGAGLLKTSDNFQTFTIYDNSNSGSFSQNDAIRVAANSTNQWLVGLNNGEIYYTNDGGANFSQVNGGTGYLCPIAAFRLGIAKNGSLYAACGDFGYHGVFGSSDNGANWNFTATPQTVYGMHADQSSNRMYWNYVQNGIGYSDNAATSITNLGQASGIAPTAFVFLSLAMAIDQNGKVYVAAGDIVNQVIEVYADDNGNGAFTRLYNSADGLPAQDTEFIMSMGIAGEKLHMITISRYLREK